jgi:ureidoacrylate peracid hydrolase
MNQPSPVVPPNPYVPRGVARPAWTFGSVDRRHAVLLLVDLQNDFCHPDGAWARVASDPDQPAMIDRLRTLLPRVRQAGVPVIYLRSVYNDWSVSSLVAERWETLGIGPVCWEGSWGSDFFELPPDRPADRITSKFRASGFLETDLELTLRAKQTETLLLAGIAGWGGLFETAYDGLARDHAVVLVEDCIAGGSQAERDAQVSAFCRFWGHRVTSGVIAEAWS